MWTSQSNRNTECLEEEVQKIVQGSTKGIDDKTKYYYDNRRNKSES